MIQEWKITLIKHRIQSAYDNLEIAKISLEKEKLYIALRDLYYAFFQMALALLLSKNIQVKSHSSVIAQFSLNFIKTDIFDLKYGRYFNELFQYRLKADSSEYLEIQKTT